MAVTNSNSEIAKNLGNWLNTSTKLGKEWFGKKIENTLASKHSFNNTVLNITTHKTKTFVRISEDNSLKSELLKISKLENKLDEILKPNSALEAESIGELIFLNDYLRPLNFIPYILAFWTILRVYVFPAISITMPLLVLIAPYFIAKFMLNLPITTSQYIEILKRMVFNGPAAGLNLTAPAVQSSTKGSSTIMPVISFGFSIFQIVIQGYWNWKHLSSIDAIIDSKGCVIEDFLHSYERIYKILDSYGIKIMRPHWPARDDRRQLVATCTLYPVYLKLHLQAMAEVDVWMSLGSHIRNGDACLTRWIKPKPGDKIQVNLQNIYDSSCSIDTRIPVNISMGEADKPAHFLLTGPNRGGKSTALRALAESLILAHTFGCCLGSRAAMTPIAHFSISLCPDDLPGIKSRFEREVDFAWGALRKKGSQIVLIDELFHSTNPPDAEKASELFTESLWKRTDIASIISTHLFNFVDHAPDCIGRLCCPAEVGEDGKIKFFYKVEPGMCRVSSVLELINKIK